jgi:nucleoside-diphosphate-sugar epimerase
MTLTLVTGAAGFVGGFLAAGLGDLGHDVTGLDMRFDPVARTRLAGIRLVEADLVAGGVPPLGAFDLVIHGAAITTPDPALGIGDMAALRANCDMTLAALDYARACGAADFVFLSSSGVFRSEDAGLELLESTPAAATLPYAIAKRAGELFVEMAQSVSLRGLAVRLGPIYGPGERPSATRRYVSPVSRWLDEAAGGQAVLVDMPLSRRDWTFGPDLPAAIVNLLSLRPALRGVVHLTSAEAIDDVELARQIADTFGVDLVHSASTSRRLPMASERIDLAALTDWTPLYLGLARTMEARP